MSDRMVYRLDTIIAYGRWLALLGVLFVALVIYPLHRGSPIWMVLLATLVMAIIAAVPVVMLYFKFYPDRVAMAFLILDSLFSLLLLGLGGPNVIFYCFLPAIAMSVRFDWRTGLVNAAVLAVGSVIAALARAGFENVLAVLGAALWPSAALLLTSLLSGVLVDSVKQEPPLGQQESQARDAELRALQAAADRARAIYEMAGMLGATLNPDRILDALLEISAAGFEELEGTPPSRTRDQPASAVFLFSAEGLYVAAGRNLSYEEMELTVRSEGGILGQVLDEAEPVRAGGLSHDANLRQFASFRRCRSAVCVPLRAGFELYGVVLCASPVPRAYTDEHVELLVAVANQAAVALTNAQLYRDLREEKEHILAVEEEARTKLARDLHDGPTQSVSAIAMRLNFARLLMDREPEKAKDELFKLENLARRTTKEIRTMLFMLRPVTLETQGLKVAIEQLVERLQETGDLPIRLEIEDVEDQLEANVKAVAWFIVREALNNAKKYAKASNIWVRAYVHDGRFVAEVEDDGVGFDFEKTMANYDQRGSFGLLNFQERADLVNGRATIQSTPGQGTRITLSVPLSREGV
jgi:signal transduction histidine kinase